jgi:UDP-glucose 4-epimerase
MKILITGGAGFIGSHLAELLIKNGKSVVAVDDLSTGRLENILHLKDSPRFSYHIDTIMNQKLMDKIVRDVDAIYHLAAAVGVKYIMDNPVKSIETNVFGTEIILSLANKYHKKVLIASTSEIYGKNGKVPFKEDSDSVWGPTYFHRWSYSCTKAVDEFLALAYWREKKTPILIVRLFNTCGPRQTGDYGMVIPRFVKQALLNQPISVHGSGKQTRCFSYVGDVVDGLSALMDAPKAIGEVFNIGTDEEISILDLAKKIKQLTKSSSAINFLSYRDVYGEFFEDMDRRVPDLSKIRRIIGYTPKTRLEDLLKITIESFQK